MINKHPTEKTELTVFLEVITIKDEKIAMIEKK
jgi:hypothetical protein